MAELKRDPIIDLMKGFAMFFVIVCHGLQRSADGIYPYTATYLWRLVYDWHMPLFFIISGYLASKSKSIQKSSFITNKFFRLLYVWFIWRWLEWIFMRFPFSGLMPFNDYVPSDFLGNLMAFFTSPIRPLWFLFFLFVFFLALWVTVKVSFGKKKLLYALLAGEVIVSVGIIAFLKVKSAWELNDLLAHYISFFGMFIAGFFYGRLQTDLAPKIGKWKINAIIVIVLGFVLHITDNYLLKTDNEILIKGATLIQIWAVAIICTFVVYLLMLLVNKLSARNVIKRYLVFMGKYSLEFYTLQFLVLNLGWFIENWKCRFVFNTLACLLVCSVFIYLIKKKENWADNILWGGFPFLKKGSKNGK